MTWRVKGFYVQIRCGISSSCWHLKNESSAVSGISMKEASERTDNNSTIICFDFRGKLRVCWPGSICNNTRLIGRCPWEMMRSQFQKYLCFSHLPLCGKNRAGAHGQRHQTPWPPYISKPPDMTPALNFPVAPHHHFKRTHIPRGCHTPRCMNYLWPLGPMLCSWNKDCCHGWIYFPDPL